MRLSAKRSVIITLAVLIVIGSAYWVGHTFQVRQQRAQESTQREAARQSASKKANVKELMALSIAANLHEDEQFQIDSAGEDTAKLQQALLAIHKERFAFWNKQSEDLSSRFSQLLGIETPGASVTLTSAQLAPVSGLMKSMAEAHKEADAYRLACKKIGNWRPVNLAAFKEDGRGVIDAGGIGSDGDSTSRLEENRHSSISASGADLLDSAQRTSMSRESSPSQPNLREDQPTALSKPRSIYSDDDVDLISIDIEPYYDGAKLKAVMRNKTNHVLPTTIIHANCYDASGSQTDNASFVIHDIAPGDTSIKEMTGSLLKRPDHVKVIEVLHL